MTPNARTAELYGMFYLSSLVLLIRKVCSQSKAIIFDPADIKMQKYARVTENKLLREEFSRDYS